MTKVTAEQRSIAEFPLDSDLTELLRSLLAGEQPAYVLRASADGDSGVRVLQRLGDLIKGELGGMFAREQGIPFGPQGDAGWHIDEVAPKGAATHGRQREIVSINAHRTFLGASLVRLALPEMGIRRALVGDLPLSEELKADLDRGVVDPSVVEPVIYSATCREGDMVVMAFGGATPHPIHRIDTLQGPRSSEAHLGLISVASLVPPAS